MLAEVEHYFGKIYESEVSCKYISMSEEPRVIKGFFDFTSVLGGYFWVSTATYEDAEP